jgi:hypothetical protein
MIRRILERLLGRGSRPSPETPTSEPAARSESRAVLRELAGYARPAAVAEIGGFRPPDDPRCSWFGGRGVGLPGEQLPTHMGEEMFPLLQINVTELPVVPPALAGVELLVLFMDRDDVPFDLPHGEGWLIREYGSLEPLVALPAPSAEPPVRPFPIRWKRVEGELPGWEDAWSLLDLTAVNEDEDATEKFFAELQNHPGTKVWGYPAEIQHEVGIEDFVFQVGSEEKAQWAWADNGIGYFFREADGSWKFACQFY